MAVLASLTGASVTGHKQHAHVCLLVLNCVFSELVLWVKIAVVTD